MAVHVLSVLLLVVNFGTITCTTTVLEEKTDNDLRLILEELRQHVKALEIKQLQQENIIQRQENRMKDLESRIQSAEKRIDSMEAQQNNLMKAKSESYIYTPGNISDINGGLKRRNEVDESQFGESKEKRNSKFEASKQEQLLHPGQNTNRNVDVPNISNPNIKTDRRKYRRQAHHTPLVSGVIAFTAQLSGVQTNVAKSQIMPFTNVVTNEGGDFKNKTGVFTCRVPGTYVFTWTTTTLDHVAIETYLNRNGDVVGYEDSRGNAQDGSGTNVVILNLDQGDNVWVSVRGIFPPDGKLWSQWSTFSGFRLHF